VSCEETNSKVNIIQPIDPLYLSFIFNRMLISQSLRLLRPEFVKTVKFSDFSTTLNENIQGPSFHKRPLPNNLIALSSKEGKEMFREAFEEGTLESYFPLAEQFITQSDPSYCSLSTLAMVLNALNFDPKKIWKGSWRWFSEEMLHCESTSVCGHSEEKIKKLGMDFHEFESLASCRGVKIKAFRACPLSTTKCSSYKYQEFHDLVNKISRNDKNDIFLVVNFSRKQLGQTGDGHYSPIGAFHMKKGYVLVLDVARFKYPPYWVKIQDMWDAMAVNDKATNQPRGYFLISSTEKFSILDESETQLPSQKLSDCKLIRSFVLD
jgi:glutathione gamma-glutamylcysteinyltransferase